MGGQGRKQEVKMYTSAAEFARARATVYYALAESMAEPIAGLQITLRQAAMVGAQVLDSEASRKAALALASASSDGDLALRENYVRAVSPVGRRPLALYESLHREGRLAGESTVKVEQHYRTLGLQPAAGELPDHVCVELAFLGSLTETEAEAHATRDSRLAARLQREHRCFLLDHAGKWLPELGSDLIAAGVPLYVVVGHWLYGFLQEELAGYRRKGRKGSRWPHLVDSDCCTLCGLCTGRCVTGALRILEDSHETRLTLATSQCVGCNLCAEICPEHVLDMAYAGSNQGTMELNCSAAVPENRRTLRRSTRLTCPRCGHPTVSEAELDGVFARLRLDDQMQQRMRLCVDCKTLF